MKGARSSACPRGRCGAATGSRTRPLSQGVPGSPTVCVLWGVVSLPGGRLPRGPPPLAWAQWLCSAVDRKPPPAPPQARTRTRIASSRWTSRAAPTPPHAPPTVRTTGARPRTSGTRPRAPCTAPPKVSEPQAAPQTSAVAARPPGGAEAASTAPCPPSAVGPSWRGLRDADPAARGTRGFQGWGRRGLQPGTLHRDRPSLGPGVSPGLRAGGWGSAPLQTGSAEREREAVGLMS